MTPETIPAIRFDLEVHYREQDNPIRAFVGVIPVRILKDKGFVPTYDHEKAPDNYQRKLKPARVSELANALRAKKVELPTAVLLNVRDCSVEKIYKNGCLDFSLVNKIYVVDGQHRIEALKKLIQEEEDDQKIKRDFFDHKIPFVCLIGATRKDEMRQFHLVNKNAKPIDASLSNRHIREISEFDAYFKNFLKIKKQDAIGSAEELLELLIRTPLWQDRIRMPNADKKTTTLTSASMNKALHRFVKHDYVEGLTEEERVKIYNTYWESIKNIFPEAFESPKLYAIQKGIGVRVLTDIFSKVLEAVRQKTSKVADYKIKDFSSVLETSLANLTGDNGTGEQVSGHEFWLSGSSGAIGQYSSEAGFRVLTDKIIHLINSSD